MKKKHGRTTSVSYTHLDVYKRQIVSCPALMVDVFEGGGPDGVVLSLVRVLIGLRVVEGLGDPVLVRNRCV